MNVLIEQLKREYLEATNALRLSKMMDNKEKSYWAKQKTKAGKQLENFNVNLNEL